MKRAGAPPIELIRVISDAVETYGFAQVEAAIAAHRRKPGRPKKFTDELRQIAEMDARSFLAGGSPISATQIAETFAGIGKTEVARRTIKRSLMRHLSPNKPDRRRSMALTLLSHHWATATDDGRARILTLIADLPGQGVRYERRLRLIDMARIATSPSDDEPMLSRLAWPSSLAKIANQLKNSI